MPLRRKELFRIFTALFLAAAAALLVLHWRRSTAPSQAVPAPAASAKKTLPSANAAPEASAARSSAGASSAAHASTDAPKRDEELLVDDFDSLTDRWLKPAKGGIAMKDAEDFAACLRAVPQKRRSECINRALNLIPDSNVMLLAGVLMDKSQDKEIVVAVFNDILNRGEEVKKPILQQVFKDRSHVCWADAAWILNATGGIPAKGK